MPPGLAPITISQLPDIIIKAIYRLKKTHPLTVQFLILPPPLSPFFCTFCPEINIEPGKIIYSPDLLMIHFSLTLKLKLPIQ